MAKYNPDKQREYNRKYMKSDDARAKAQYRNYKSHGKKFLSIATNDDLLAMKELLLIELDQRGLQ
ncbi:TPA: hypothetical protein ACGOR8_002006 [Streptococcus suis]